MLIDLHIVFVSLTLLLVLYADEEALRYLLGKRETLDAGIVRFLHYAVAFGLAGIIVTGGFLYARRPDFYLADPAFIAKMVAVAALIVNSVFLDRFSADATRRPFRSLLPRKRRMFLVSGAVSALGWLTALVCGLLL